jgi:hypothetical protein
MQKIKNVTKEYCELCQKSHADAILAVKEQIKSNFTVSTTLICIFITALGVLMGFHVI